jgi:hypothetical protein
MAAACEGASEESSTEARRAAVELKPGNLVSMTLVERMEMFACVALALHRAGERDAALVMLKRALELAPGLASRGSLDAFARLCRAVSELVPERAAALFGGWVQAVAARGADEIVLLVAFFLRSLPAADLSDLAVNPETGELRRPQQATL